MSEANTHDPTYKLAVELFKKMSSTGKPLNLEELRSLLTKVPAGYRKSVQAVLSKHIFTNQSFEMDQPTFCTMYYNRFKPKPRAAELTKPKRKAARININLPDLVEFTPPALTPEPVESEPPQLSFTERLVVRLQNRKDKAESSLRKILDDGELICEK